MAAKAVATDAERPLRNGGKAFGRPLRAGFDYSGATEIKVNHRPGSVWSLMDQGRRSSGPIYPRIGGRRNRRRTVKGRAVMTPYGPRASSSYGSARPPHPGLIRRTFARERDVAGTAAHRQFVIAVGRRVKG
jgi:hypothetical protein